MQATLSNKMPTNHTALPVQALLFSGSKSSLRRLGAIVLFFYICGIGYFLWSSQLRCQKTEISSSPSQQLTQQLWQVEQRGNYLVICNYVRAELTLDSEETVTLASAVTLTDLIHVPEVCRRWRGPLSIAVYAPGPDFKSTLKTIFRFRQCAHPCVRQNVTWHLYYDLELGPEPEELSAPEVEAELRSSECQVAAPTHSFRHHVNLPFPANIGRNVARLQSRTRYFLISDLNFYPSKHIVPWFLKLVKSQSPAWMQVYVIPVFYVMAGQKPPNDKDQLVAMVNQGHATLHAAFNHSECHVFPGADEWLLSQPPNGSLAVYSVTRRRKNSATWQPFFISTQFAPMLAEELTVEGRQDRLTQAFELCLQGYDFYILDNAFLAQVSQEEQVGDVGLLHLYIQENAKANDRLVDVLTCHYGLDHGC